MKATRNGSGTTVNTTKLAGTQTWPWVSRISKADEFDRHTYNVVLYAVQSL